MWKDLCMAQNQPQGLQVLFPFLFSIKPKPTCILSFVKCWEMVRELQRHRGLGQGTLGMLHPTWMKRVRSRSWNRMSFEKLLVFSWFFWRFNQQWSQRWPEVASAGNQNELSQLKCLQVVFLGCESVPYPTDTSTSSRWQGTKEYLLIDSIGIYCRYCRKSRADSWVLCCEHHRKSISTQFKMHPIWLLCWFCPGHLRVQHCSSSCDSEIIYWI